MGTVNKVSPDGGNTQYDIRDNNIAPVELTATASEAYAIGDQFVLDSDGKTYKAADTIAQGGTIIIKPATGYNAELAGSVSEQLNAKVGWDVAGKSVKKNLVPRKFNSGTPLNITVTDNGDGTLNFNGTANASNYFGLTQRTPTGAYFYLPKGNYIYTVDGSTFINRVAIYTTYNSSAKQLALSEQGVRSLAFSIDDNTTSDYKLADGSVLVSIYVGVLQNVSFSNVTIKPMIRDSRIADSTYEPFIYDNTELLSYADNGVLGAKNLLLPTYETKTSNGVKFSCDANNIITATRESANASASSYFIPISDEAKGKTIKISGCPASGNNSKYDVRIYNVTTSTAGGTDETDYGDGVIVTIPNNDNSYALRLIYRSGYSDTVIFKPMLTLASDPIGDYANYFPPTQTNRQLTVNKAEISAIGDDESGRTKPSRSYAVGEYFYKDGQNCRVKSAVTTSSNWTLDTNYEVKSIDSVLAVKEGTITPATGITLNDSSKLIKQGSLVNLNGMFQGVSCEASIDTLLGSVPNGYEPSHAVNTVGVTSTATEVLRITIGTSGNIYVYSGVALNNKTIDFNVVYDV